MSWELPGALVECGVLKSLSGVESSCFFLSVITHYEALTPTILVTCMYHFGHRLALHWLSTITPSSRWDQWWELWDVVMVLLRKFEERMLFSDNRVYSARDDAFALIGSS